MLFYPSFGNPKVTASLGYGGTHSDTALWTQGGVWVMGKEAFTDPADPFNLS